MVCFVLTEDLFLLIETPFWFE